MNKDDEKFIDILTAIKSKCIRSPYCLNCQFLVGNGICQFQLLTDELKQSPEKWNIELIKEILEKK